MDQTNEHPNPKKDDQLADFADQVLRGTMNQPASPPTDDLLGLEETILRLNSSFPPTSLDDATVKQMHVRLKARIRREGQAAKPSFWKKWFGREVTPQLGLAFAVLAVLVVMVLTSPSLTPSVPPTTGTASTPISFMVIVGLVAVLFIVYWFTRRK
ncbi:MAG: hypothetical protein HYZ21_01525 [Chloroflexi bacterium]|nr:hypothetical protein [Chloroflexota bacterium]